MDADNLYQQLRQLAATFPALRTPEAVDQDARIWLGRAAVLVAEALDGASAATFTIACDHLGQGSALHQLNVSAIESVFYRALASAEKNASVASQGSFIGVGRAFDALAALTKVFARARKGILLVDGYADMTAITDYLPAAPAKIALRVLTAESAARRAALTPAVKRWVQQFGAERPLEVRCAPAAQLHDRLVFVDEECWVMGQSLNGLAVRSPSYLQRLDQELEKQKIEAYGAIWQSAAVLP